MRAVFDRGAQLAERARSIDSLDQDSTFTLTFRFRTVGRGSYAGLAFVGVRKAGGGFMTNAAGVTIFRHNEKMGLVGNAFVADGEGVLHSTKDRWVSLEYDTVYDVRCVYSPGERTVTATFTDILRGEQVGEPDVTQLPDGGTWQADRLACWNYADGRVPSARLTLLIDDLQYGDGPRLTFDTDLEELPMGDEKQFAWHGVPEPPLVTSLTVPEEVFDQDVSFEAEVRPDIAGIVRFELKRWAGETLWSREAEIADGKAAAVLEGRVASGLEKGSRALVATANGREGQAACKSVVLRGRVFRNVNEAPADMQPGDEIVITDLGSLRPAEAIAEHTAKGKWWRRGYTIAGDAGKHALVCVEEQDLDEPESCLAGPLTLPLDLDGWYEVWVRTYRHRECGGIDVRLSGEQYFVHMDPLQVNTIKGEASPPFGALVDVRYRAADLTGQDLVFQQPYGTYESATKLCNASLAGVRLVELSDEQVAKIQAERAHPDTKLTAYDNDGFSYFHRWAVHSPDCVARLLEPLRDQSTAFLNFELGGLGGITIPTPYTGMYQMTGHTRHGDYRANAFYRWCFENDVNLVDVLTERAHEVGLKLFVSLMMERSFSPDDTMKAHPEWRVTKGRGRWNYAHPGVQDYQVKKIAWIMENHEIDGFIVDFTRYGYYFNEDEPDKFGHMNAFLRKLRAATDRVNAKKQRKVLLCCSFADESRFIRHWGTGKLEDQGLDVATWIDEGLFDMLMPEGPTMLDWVERAKGTKTAVWPRKPSGYDFATSKILDGGMSPKQLERGVKQLFDAGAPGVFFFNHETWTTLGRLGFKEELDLRAKSDATYGLREGPVIEFDTWYPNLEQRNAQRATLIPVTVAVDESQRADGELTIPLRNTFPVPVTASVRFAAPAEDGAATWSLSPPEQSAKIGPGEQASLAFRVEGSAPTQSAVPAAFVELSTEHELVFRHRFPVRAVPHTTCRHVAQPPTAADLAYHSFLGVDSKGDLTGEARVAIWRDDTSLHVLCERTGIDVSQTPREREERDARSITQAENFTVFLDTAGAEQAYLEFCATPAGGQWDARTVQDSFAGHFMRKADWDGDWQTKTTWRDDGYVVEIVIPFETLGTTPSPGETWRMNVAAKGLAGEGERSVSSWSSSESDYGRPRCFGTVVFE